MTDETAKAVGNRIRRRRNRLRLSQPKLAKLLDVPQQTIAGWETGKAEVPRKLVDIADALCTTPKWLLKEEGPEVVIPTALREHLSTEIDSLDPQLMPAVIEFIRSLSQTEVGDASLLPARKLSRG